MWTGRTWWLSAWWKVAIPIAALVLAGVPVVMAKAGTTGSPAAAYTSHDFGFAEGAGTADADLGQRLDGITGYGAGQAPFVRTDLDWWGMQPCADCAIDWSRLDAIVDGATPRGLRVVLILDAAPPWANGGHKEGRWFPTSDAAWRSIVDAAVAHFGPKVAGYEVWNEPNLETSGEYAGDRRLRYWQLVRLAYPRIHAGCSGCVVLAGATGYGTPSTPQRNDNEPSAWLDWAYGNGYGAYFDALAHHPYPAWNSGKRASDPECTVPWWDMFGPADQPNCGELGRLRAVMVAHGDGAKKIWATEFGYPTSGATGLPLEVVRDRLVEGITMWRSLSYTGPLFLYSYRDACIDATNPECNFGVVSRDFTPKGVLHTDAARTLTGGWPASLATEQSLRRWSSLRAGDGSYQVWLQGDDNLVVYRAAGTALWSSHTAIDPTSRIGDQGRLVNQADGNLVLYRDDGMAVWTSGTAGNGPSTLWMQQDGNLVLYRNRDAKPIWASNTAQ